MTKYLILGGTGFIGKNLTEVLGKDKRNILSIFDKNRPEIQIESEHSFIEGKFDITCDFEKLTFGFDVVIHLISLTIPSSKIQIEEEIELNVFPTIRLIEACCKNRNKLIFISSGGTVYGDSNYEQLDENHPTNPVCSYGIVKLMIEKYIALYSCHQSLDYRIIRLGNPYGKYQTPNTGQGVIPTFIYKTMHGEPITIFGDGENLRDYIYITDAVRGIANIIHYTGKFRLFNVGNGKGYKINELLYIISELTDTEPQVSYVSSRKLDVKKNVLDVSLYNETFGDYSRIDIREGIQRSIWYLSQTD